MSNTITRTLAIGEIFFIVVLACIPLFATFPYRVNIFLSWEGAYRLSQGQIPFKDFGTPLGGMYWLVPSIFFKIFGPQLISLIKAQVFMNIIAGFSFLSILGSLGVHKSIRFVSVVLFCISYSFFNFWPWYNHSVIVYELIALAFLFKYISVENAKYGNVWLILSALFICFSILTKQDGGGLAFVICLTLLIYYCITRRRGMPLVVFSVSFMILLFAIIYPFTKYEFGYWFNHGQAPHSARVSAFEIIDEFFTFSQWIKFYLFIAVLLFATTIKSFKELKTFDSNTLFFLLTVGILAEAAIFQVTSYTPPDNNIFFHSFSFAYILTVLSRRKLIDFNKMSYVLICLAGVMIWWSTTYWKYIQRIVERTLPDSQVELSAGSENVVNRKTYMITGKDTLDEPVSDWVYSGLKSFDKIYMPKSTVSGIKRFMELDIIKHPNNVKVLNMSELTPLAAEVPFELEKNDELPLWYHLGVGMFNRQADIYEKRIAEHYYDIVLFEYVPTLNNFYPFRVRDSLKKSYKMIDSFMAPRRGETKGNIEIYVRP